MEHATLDRLKAAQLTESERRAIKRFASRLDDELGGRDRYGRIAGDLSEEVALAEGESPFNYSVHVHDPEWVRDRRAIESFFIQEVDRDKIVLAGSALD
jgi:hypothetical protein